MSNNYLEVFMKKSSDSNLLSIYEKSFNELYYADTIVEMTRQSCKDREFSGQYYGVSEENAAKLSAERNHYINMLDMLSERISNMKNFNLLLEQEIMLQQYPNNSC